MRRFPLPPRPIIAALLFAAASVPAAAVVAAPTPVTVDAATAIYNADNPNAVAAGVPVAIPLPMASTNFTFTLGVPGETITVDGGQNLNDADGLAPSTVPQLVRAAALPPTSSNSGTRTLSGIKSFGAGYITGVFLGANQVAKPNSVDYTQVGTGLLSYAPVLQQVFYIGDGLTGDGFGSRQTFFIPTGAVALYLGISDAEGFTGAPSAYGDNRGSFTGFINFGTQVVPEPGALSLLTIGLVAIAARRRRR